MGCLYQLIKTMKEHHLIDETPHSIVKDTHVHSDELMKALSDIENEILKSLSEDRKKEVVPNDTKK